MILSTPNAVYHAHFRHLGHAPRLNTSNGKLYNITTECSLHVGMCIREPKGPCQTAGEHVFLGRSKKSVLDAFDRHKGHFQAFQRALNAMTTNRVLRTALFTEYWSRVRKPQRRH